MCPPTDDRAFPPSSSIARGAEGGNRALSAERQALTDFTGKSTRVPSQVSLEDQGRASS